MTAAADVQTRDFRMPPLRPLTALRAFGRLVRDKEDTAQVFEIMRALSGGSLRRGYDQMLTTVEGGRQAYLREELARKLDDPDWLAKFPEGSVGGAYRAFREARGFTAEGLADEARKVAPETVDAPHPIVWYSRRIRDVHDVWHVLTGYGTDALGEACVVSFSHAQTGNLGFAFIGWGAAAEIRREARAVPALRAVAQAWRLGQAARWLPSLDYEALFAEPLEAARARLGLRPPTVYLGVPEAVRAGLKLRS
ncbi:MAG: ubiquinone biosynthesis protein [Alphaproteobacteria bacterium]|nr:ubiquinone biosynthesis protein [Alphaproteobacteria bacterium]MBU1525820.1 ubiquinone biosynthesis protein [Alphaproteobacteria bacterium]MBU2118312.1 ubiquinone biosynthesis protein [Alphaproteobacteria bacterium]MBU2350037.1 ubiquinone biosynthesis protein [Alphaproteobacteria bacterium]MBU2383218.1 ubiquinone biosynthesis protein [Alphaproteobacteria bacterium]